MRFSPAVFALEAGLVYRVATELSKIVVQSSALGSCLAGKLMLELALHEKSLFGFFSVQPLCALCLCGCVFLSNNEPQRHRAHRGCTEKSVYAHFCAKPLEL